MARGESRTACIRYIRIISITRNISHDFIVTLFHSDYCLSIHITSLTLSYCPLLYRHLDLSPIRQRPRSPAASPHKIEASPKFQRSVAFTIPSNDTPPTENNNGVHIANGHPSTKQLEFLSRQTQLENEELTKKLKAKEVQGK